MEMAASSVSSSRLLPRLKGRDKPQLSCSFCRKRKLRCDRRHPCDSCERLGQASTCSFSISQSLSTRKVAAVDPMLRNALQERIDNLESLVRSLAPAQQTPVAMPVNESVQSPIQRGASTQEAIDSLPDNVGCIKLQDDESSYTESSHWTAILDEISDFRNMFRDHESPPDLDSQTQQSMHSGLGLFLDQVAPVTKIDIISALPPLPIVDGMIAKFFSSADMPVTLIIHRNVFFRQYEAFWERPFETPIIWVTTLFGMIFTTAFNTLYIANDITSLDSTTLTEYTNVIAVAREKMIQCLHLGNYMKGAPHTIEALLFLVPMECLQGDQAQYGCWQLIGVAVRIALKMGYHRDGSHFPNVSAYEAEMRRRVWYILMQFDIASAAQVGLPRTIKEAQSNTMEPRSLRDDDFDESTTNLPPARPETEHTLAQFLIYKSRVVAVYGRICDFMTPSGRKDYDEVMQQLNNAFKKKPAVLESKPMQRSILDGTQLITRRLYIAMVYHHAQMTLHRKFSILGKHVNQYAYSYTTCTAAALSALQFQEELFEQCQPGRMMYADRWKILSLIQSEFLLATTVLCLTVDDDLTRPQSGSSSSRPDTNQCVEKLRRSQSIWMSQTAFSKESQTAIKAIDIVLRKASSAGCQAISGIDSASSLDTIRGSLSPSSPQSFAQQSLASDDSSASAHTTDGVTNWNEILDFDMSWDSWVQL